MASANLNDAIQACIDNGLRQSECSAIFTAQFKAEYPSYDFTNAKSNHEDTRKDYDNIRTRISRKYSALKPVTTPVIPETSPGVNSDNDTVTNDTASYDAAFALVMETLKADATAAFLFIKELSDHHNF